MANKVFTSVGFALIAAVGCTTDRADSEVVEVRRSEAVVVEPVPDNDAADNSVQNRGDEKAGALTADDQSNASSDVELTAKIRRALTKNEALSVYAHNVKIITRQGNVVLKGPVRSLEEKGVVEKTAIGFAGVTHVRSELEIDSH